MSNAGRRSVLGGILLGMLAEEPMHAYRLQKLLRMQGKERVVNIRQRATVYQTLERLLRMGLIRVRERVSGDSHPDRTVYEVTERGRETAPVWLRESLQATEEFPEFVAALSVLMGLSADDAREQLEARARLIGAQLAEVEAALGESRESLSRPFGPTPLIRAFLLEEEYRQAMLTAELRWLELVVDDLRGGRLAWDAERVREFAAAFEEYQHDDD